MNTKEQKALQLAMEAFDYMVVPRGFHVQKICQKAYEAIVEALEPVYSAPPSPEQRTANCLLTGVCASEGHKIQKQRAWVSLTDEEKKIIDTQNTIQGYHGDYYDSYGIMEDVEILLKEKNK